MANKYITIQNFKFGLDVRRSELTSQPGTLARCENAHVNHGGEIEKRKGFYSFAVQFPTNTYGFEVTAAGMVTFGSDANPNAALPGGVTYVRLQHPDSLAMTGVVYSCNFQGEAFVIAKFSDTVTLCFYNGVIVADSWNGRVLVGRTGVSTLATDLTAQINALEGWLATANVGPNGFASAGSVIAKSPPGITFAAVDQVTTALSGVIGELNLNDTDTQLAGTPTSAAFAAFLVVAGTNGTYTITAPAASDGSGTAILCSGVARQSTIASTGHFITNDINLSTIITGYTAYTDGAGNVFVAAPASWGALANGFTLTINITGDVSWTTAAVQSPMTFTLNPTPVTLSASLKNGGYFTISPQVIIKGGYAPYIVAWAEQTVGSANGISFNSAIVGAGNPYFQATSQFNVCQFYATLLGPVTIVTGYFTVTITDSHPGTPQVVTLNFPVSLQNL